LEGAEQVHPVRLVLAHAGDAFVLPVPGEAIDAGSAGLHVPDEDAKARGGVGLLVRVEPLEDWRNSAEADRWQAYHGRPGWSTWARLRVESGRSGGWVFDGEAVRSPNHLAPAEPRLCRAANADRAALRRGVEKLLGTNVDEPLVVGVDPVGVDVRTRLGVTRLEFGGLLDASSAEAWLGALLAEGRAPGQ
jgi:hypothetical protein